MSAAFSAALDQYNTEREMAAKDDAPAHVPQGSVRVLVRGNTAYFAHPDDADRKVYMVTYWARGEPAFVRLALPDWVRWIEAHTSFKWPSSNDAAAACKNPVADPVS